MAIKIVNTNNFEKTIAKGLVLVDFYAEWCGPCKMVAPILEDIANELNDVVIAKLDVDQNLQLASQFSVSGVPTLVLFKDGKEVDRVIGFKVKNDLVRWINSYK